jgi:hypothetical protein
MRLFVNLRGKAERNSPFDISIFSSCMNGKAGRRMFSYGDLL